jgi:hypothetical protein
VKNLRRWTLAALALAFVAGASAQDSAPPPPDIVETLADPAAASEDAPVPTSSDDVTESVQLTPSEEQVVVGPSAASMSSAAESPEQSTRAKVSGWARESLEFMPYDNGLDRGDRSDVTRVPRDRFLSRTQLLVRASYLKGRSFEASVSGALGIAVHVEGSGQDLGYHGWGSQGTGEVLDASLRDAFLGFYSRWFDLRLGQQRVAWGVADVLSPNDVVNARDLRDPFLSEPELLRVPTPLARGTFYMGPVSLELLFSPVFVPDRASVYGRTWSAVQPDAPAEVRGLFAMLTRVVDPSIQDQVNEALYQTRLPNRNGRGMSGGGKLSVHSHSLDLNFYYHYGYDGTPYLWINPSLLNVLRATDFSKAGFENLAPVLRAVDQGFVPLYAEYVRRHHAGFDLVAEAGPFMLRVDAAYQSQRVFYRTDLTSIATPTFMGVLSLDYQTGSVEKVLILEGVYIRLLEKQSSPLLAYKQDTYGVAGVVRWPLFSILHIEVRTMVGIAPFFYVAQPALLVKVADFQIKLGALALNGEHYSLGGYYRHNTTAFLQVRYGF